MALVVSPCASRRPEEPANEARPAITRIVRIVANK
jgi:hypothetical protein